MSTPTPQTPPPAPSYYIDETDLQSGHYYQPLILNKIFLLLVLMINVIQRTAANQAQRLNFLAAWQKAYTDEMNQIHAFVGGNGDAASSQLFGGPAPVLNFPGGPNGNWATAEGLDTPGNQEVTNIRQDMNTANTGFTQQMQGNRQVISDSAQALQTDVNQSNDAVQSQTDMATSILQTLSTILTSIYQSSA